MRNRNCQDGHIPIWVGSKEPQSRTQEFGKRMLIREYFCSDGSIHNWVGVLLMAVRVLGGQGPEGTDLKPWLE